MIRRLYILLLFFSTYTLLSQQLQVEGYKNNIPAYSSAIEPNEIQLYLDSMQSNIPFKVHAVVKDFATPPAATTIESTGDRIFYTWKLEHRKLEARLFLNIPELLIGDSILLFKEDGSIHEIITNNLLTGKFYTTEAIGNFQYLQLRTGETKTSSIQITGISHQPLSREFLSKNSSFGDSQPCQVNVNCSEGDSYTAIRNAVVRILIRKDNLLGFCTGTLLNNTNFDHTPYLITAEHCGIIGGDFVDQNDLNNWTFYFNYQSPFCPNPPTDAGLDNQKMTGASLLARSDDEGGETGSDFLLLRLKANIPGSFNAFYAGWNRSSSAVPESGVSIHHPEGDIKKISTYINSAQKGAFGENINYDTHWVVEWKQTLNGYGTTERGSSGCPLFDGNQLFRGQLTGGGSSCSNTDQADYYGMMNYNWMSNGQSNDRWLSPWLDPDNKGYLSIGGIYADDSLPEINGSFSVFPSPVSSTLFLGDFGDPAEDVNLFITDLAGKVVYSKNTVTTPGLYEEIPVTLWRPGVYLVYVLINDEVKTRKIVVLNAQN